MIAQQALLWQSIAQPAPIVSGANLPKRRALDRRNLVRAKDLEREQAEAQALQALQNPIPPVIDQNMSSDNELSSDDEVLLFPTRSERNRATLLAVKGVNATKAVKKGKNKNPYASLASGAEAPVPTPILKKPSIKKSKAKKSVKICVDVEVAPVVPSSSSKPLKSSLKKPLKSSLKKSIKVLLPDPEDIHSSSSSASSLPKKRNHANLTAPRVLGGASGWNTVVSSSNRVPVAVQDIHNLGAGASGAGGIGIPGGTGGDPLFFILEQIEHDYRLGRISKRQAKKAKNEAKLHDQRARDDKEMLAKRQRELARKKAAEEVLLCIIVYSNHILLFVYSKLRPLIIPLSHFLSLSIFVCH